MTTAEFETGVAIATAIPFVVLTAATLIGFALAAWDERWEIAEMERHAQEMERYYRYYTALTR